MFAFEMIWLQGVIVYRSLRVLHVVIKHASHMQKKIGRRYISLCLSPPSALLCVMRVSLYWSDFVHYNILAMPLDGRPLFSLLDNSPNVNIFGEKRSVGWWKFLVCQISFAFSVDAHFSMLSLISITEGKHAENMYLECWRSTLLHSQYLTTK